jgi:HK97 family phage prohead protease
MPWTVERTDRCPASRPWGVIREGGALEGCHATREMANRQRAALYAQEGSSSMLHKTLEAKATTTELGEFTAIAAAYSIDRGGERIVPGAFSKTIEKWQASGKMIPLHWDHRGDPEDIIGTVDPQLVKETDVGLMVGGKLDLEGSDRATKVWRAMKDNSVALSFGYMVIDGGENKSDEVYDLREVDLFEISVTPAPMNADTKFLALKSATATLIEENLLLAGRRKFGEATEVEHWDEQAVTFTVPGEDEFSYLRGPYEGIGPQIELSAEFTAVTKTVTYEPVGEATTDAVEDAEGEEPDRAKPSAQDSLKRQSLDAALDALTDGASRKQLEEEEEPEPPADPPSEDDQRRRLTEFYLSL